MSQVQRRTGARFPISPIWFALTQAAIIGSLMDRLRRQCTGPYSRCSRRYTRERCREGNNRRGIGNTRAPIPPSLCRSAGSHSLTSMGCSLTQNFSIVTIGSPRKFALGVGFQETVGVLSFSRLGRFRYPTVIYGLSVEYGGISESLPLPPPLPRGCIQTGSLSHKFKEVHEKYGCKTKEEEKSGKKREKQKVIRRFTDVGKSFESSMYTSRRISTLGKVTAT